MESHPTDGPEGSPEFSRIIATADIPAEGNYDVSLSPTRPEEEALAAMLGIVEVRKLSFEGTLQRVTGGGVTCTAQLGATVTQSCVVTLELVKTRIEEPVIRRYLAATEIPKDGYQILEDEDVDVDVLGAEIDIAALAREALALALPTYPRKHDAELSETVFSAPGTVAMTDDDAKPFAALADLKKKLADKS